MWQKPLFLGIDIVFQYTSVVWYWRVWYCIVWYYINLPLMELCDSSLCFSINSSAWLPRKYAQPAKNPTARLTQEKKRKHDTENAAAGKEKNFCWFTRAGIVYSEFFRVFPHSVLGGCPSGEEAIMSSILMPSPPLPPKTHLPQTVIPIRGILTQSWGFRASLIGQRSKTYFIKSSA